MIETCYKASCDKCKTPLYRMGRHVQVPVFKDRAQIMEAIRKSEWVFDVTGRAPVMLCKSCKAGKQ